MSITDQRFSIRPVLPEDLEDFVAMARKAFVEAYADQNTAKNIEHYLRESFTVEQISRELMQAGSHFFILKKENQIIGYTKVNQVPAQADIHDPESLEIARLYVLKAFQSQRFGQNLLEYALAFAKQNQKKYVWLGVWEHNPKAIRFYEKNGFEKFGTHPFPFGDEVQTDWLMRREV
ncbi:GNAT family N-acetyltransferase [Algoriphagus namhaensis]